MIALYTTKHESIGKDSKFTERFLSRSVVTELLNWIEKFLIKNGDMLHATMEAARAAIVLIHIPI